MSRSKKRKKQPPEKAARAKNQELFNPSFKALKALLREEKTMPAKVSPEQPVEADKKNPDDEAFYEAMQDVTPLPGATGKRFVKPVNTRVKPPHAPKNDDLEALARLTDLVSGSVELDISFSDEYIEGCVPGFGPKLMSRLKKGRFPIQDHIDLHGLTRQDAEKVVREFLLQSYRLGLRCVLIVHGRGLKSENRIPILKKFLPVWLNRGPVKKTVLAFSTARPYDGGTGAIYILLRKRSGTVPGQPLQRC